MIRIVNPVLAALAVLAAGVQLRAATPLHANLTHDQESNAGPLLTSSGQPRALSSGTADFVLNDAQTAMTMSVTVFNIDINGLQTPNDTNDNLVAAHIHAAAPPGTNAGVRWGFFGAPDNDTNPDNLVVTPFLDAVGGTFASTWDAPEGNGGTTLTAQLPSILAELSYINFHTNQFGGGEIRGQITVVPEPSLVGLFAGFGVLALGRRRTAR